MGTRSRIKIKRYTKTNIYLWMHWDGYISGQGYSFYKCIQNLINKYSSAELYNMVESLNIVNIEDGKYQDFDASLFFDFIEGKTDFYNDKCNNVEYEYQIDFKYNHITIIHNEINTLITFDMIKNGFDILSLEKHYKESDYEETHY